MTKLCTRFQELQLISNASGDNPHYWKKNVDRRDKRKEEHISALKCTVKEQKSEISKLTCDLKTKEETIDHLHKKLSNVTTELTTTTQDMQSIEKEKRQSRKQTTNNSEGLGECSNILQKNIYGFYGI